MTMTEQRAMRGRGRARSSSGESGEQGRTTVGWWIGTVLSWLLLMVVTFILLTLVIVPRVSGAQAYTVLTGSMSPTYEPGALVVVKPVPAEELRAGDAITFQPYSGNPAVVTHRITGIFYDTNGQMKIHTQGDANNIADDWSLVPEQVRGKVWYSVPQLGRVNSLLQTGTRSTLIIVVAGGLIAYSVWMIGSGLLDRSRRKNGGDAAAVPGADQADENDESSSAAPTPAEDEMNDSLTAPAQPGETDEGTDR